MAHTTLVPQPLEKSDKKYDYHTISKEFATTPGSTKSSPTTPKASSTSTLNRLTTQDIINASLRKSTCQKYLYYQTRWKEYCAQKNIAYDSPTVDQFLSFFNELFNQGVFQCSDLCKKCSSTCTENEIPTHLSTPISNKIFQRIT